MTDPERPSTPDPADATRPADAPADCAETVTGPLPEESLLTGSAVADAGGAAASAAPHEYRRSLYRTYRPQTFAEVVGQDHVARTLTNAITLNTVAHGYVFAGPRGTGKTSMARILAKALDCTGQDPAHPLAAATITPCGTCESCVRIANAESLDVIEMDAASHRSIDDIRELRDTIAYAPVQSRYKVYIIDEAHMLTREAFNALLKTLEEPPPNVVFVLATTEAHKLPETIVSRCQRFDFRRPRVAEVVMVLRRVATGEGFEIDDEALDTIAEHSEGGFRDAIGALERLTTFATPGEKVGTAQVLDLLGVTDTELLIEIMEIVADRDTVEALAFVDRLFGRGINWTQFINDLLRHLRRLFLLQNVGHGAKDPQVVRALAQTVGLHEQLIERLEPQASRLDPGGVIRLMELLGKALGEIKAGLDGRLQLELALVKVTRPELDLSLEGLDARLQALETGAGGAGGPPREPGAAGPPRAPGAAQAKAKPGPAQQSALRPSPEPKPSPVSQPKPSPVAQSEPSRVAQPSAVEGKATVPQAGAAAVADEEVAWTDEPAPVSDEQTALAGESSVAAATTSTLLEQTQSSWPQIVERVRAYSAPVCAMVSEGRAVAEDESRVTIAVAAPFQCEKLSEAGNASIVAGAIAEVLSRTVTVAFTVDAKAAAPSPSAASKRAGLSIEEAIALSRQKLDARLVEDEI
jgi:DNA polymerase-3 subunit gamma/tau